MTREVVLRAGAPQGSRFEGYGTAMVSGLARDVMLGPMKTCAELGPSVCRYRGDRLAIPDGVPVPPLPDLVTRNAAA